MWIGKNTKTYFATPSNIVAPKKVYVIHNPQRGSVCVQKMILPSLHLETFSWFIGKIQTMVPKFKENYLIVTF